MITIFPMVVGLVLILLSQLIKNPDYRGLITGFDSLKDDEKEKNGEAIARDTSRILLVVGFISIALGSMVYLGVSDIILVLFLNFLAFFIIYSLLKKRAYSPPNNSHKLIAVVLVVGVLIVNIMGYYSTSAASLIIANDKYKLSGMYSMNDDLNNISKVELINELPEVKRKLNGFAFNNIYKGRFNIGEDTSAYLNLVSLKPPYLFIQSSKFGYIYINTSSPEETKKYYLVLRMKRDKENK